jgi:hypothetical protein
LEIPNCDGTPFGRQALQPGLSAGIKRGFIDMVIRAGRERLIDRALVPGTILTSGILTFAWIAFLVWLGWRMLNWSG